MVWGGQGLAFWYLEYESELLTKHTRTNQYVTKRNPSLLKKPRLSRLLREDLQSTEQTAGKLVSPLGQKVSHSYLCAPYGDWVPLFQSQEFQSPPGPQPDPLLLPLLLLRSHSSGAKVLGQEWRPSLSGCFNGNKNKGNSFKPINFCLSTLLQVSSYTGLGK